MSVVDKGCGLEYFSGLEWCVGGDGSGEMDVVIHVKCSIGGRWWCGYVVVDGSGVGGEGGVGVGVFAADVEGDEVAGGGHVVVVGGGW